MRRETGATESADPAPTSSPTATEPGVDAESSTVPSDDRIDAPVRDERREPGAADSNPDRAADTDQESGRSDELVHGQVTPGRPSEPTMIADTGVPGGVSTLPANVGHRGDSTTSGLNGGESSFGTAGQAPDTAPATPRNGVLPIGVDSNAGPAGAVIAATTATANASATGVARSVNDSRSAAGREAVESKGSASPMADAGGSKLIPEGMRGLDRATMIEVDPRSRGSATEDRPTRQRGGTAVARAAELNTELRNARSDGDAGNGPRPAGPSGSAVATAAGSISTGIAIPGPASSGPDAQSLPTGPASVAPMEAGGESGRTVGGVARGLQALSSQRGGTLVMRLDPGNLGQVRMEMSLEAGRVQVVIAAAGDAARGLLRENLGVLRHALEDRGFAVERLTVESTARTTTDSSGPRGDSRGDGQDARGGQGSSDRQDASDERSRGRRDDAAHRRTERGRSDSDRFQEVLAGSGETSTA